MLVHFESAVEQLLEIVPADAERDAHADGGPQRVAAADPVPELEHVVHVDAEFGDFFGGGAEGDEVLGDDVAVAAVVGEEPVSSSFSVRDGFLGSESAFTQ